MFWKLVMTLGLVLPVLVPQAAVAAEPLPPAGRWIPQEAIVALELCQPAALLELALDEKVAAAVTSLPAYQQQASQPGFKQFLGVVKFLETTLGTDWQTGLRKLVGGGVTLATTRDGAIIVIVDAEDEKMLEKLHEILLGFARGEATKQGQPDRVVSKEYRGVTGWTFGKDEAHAIVGSRLLVTNKPEALKAVLDLRADPDGRSLATLPAYQAAKKAAGADAAATVFVNLGVLKEHPPVKQALANASNPLASLLLPGVTEALRGSSWLALGLHTEDDTLVLQATVDGKMGGPSAIVLPDESETSALPNLAVPRLIAGFTFCRDLHSFYAAKDELFPERTSGLIFFENMMGIFFSGRDLTEEVLGETRPEIRFVVAQQEYDPAIGTPRLQLPSFAAIFRLHHPEEFAEVAEEAWQKVLGLINFTRGQQALPGLIIDRPSQGDVRFSVAYFSSSGEKSKTGLDSRFNFRPALAKLGDHLILSSTEGLARDLIDALKKEMAGQTKALAQTHSLVELHGAQLASILDANRESLVRQNMVAEGNTEQQAEATIDLIGTVLKYLDRVKLSLATRDGQPRAKVELTLNLP